MKCLSKCIKLYCFYQFCLSKIQMHRIIFFPEKKIIKKKNICVPTIPKVFRPVGRYTKHTKFFIWPNTTPGRRQLKLPILSRNLDQKSIETRAFSPYHQGPIIGPIPNPKYPPFFPISKKKFPIQMMMLFNF